MTWLLICWSASLPIGRGLVLSGRLRLACDGSAFHRPSGHATACSGFFAAAYNDVGPSEWALRYFKQRQTRRRQKLTSDLQKVTSHFTALPGVYAHPAGVERVSGQVTQSLQGEQSATIHICADSIRPVVSPQSQDECGTSLIFLYIILGVCEWIDRLFSSRLPEASLSRQELPAGQAQFGFDRPILRYSQAGRPRRIRFSPYLSQAMRLISACPVGTPVEPSIRRGRRALCPWSIDGEPPAPLGYMVLRWMSWNGGGQVDHGLNYHRAIWPDGRRGRWRSKRRHLRRVANVDGELPAYLTYTNGALDTSLERPSPRPVTTR